MVGRAFLDLSSAGSKPEMGHWVGWAEIVLVSSGSVALEIRGDSTGLRWAGFPLFPWMAARDHHITNYLTPQVTGVF